VIIIVFVTDGLSQVGQDFPRQHLAQVPTPAQALSAAAQHISDSVSIIIIVIGRCAR